MDDDTNNLVPVDDSDDSGSNGGNEPQGYKLLTNGYVSAII